MKILKWVHSLLSPKPSTSVPIDSPIASQKPNIDFHPLDHRGNSYYTSYKVPYTIDGVLKKQTIERVFDFAYKMAFTTEGAHRDTRSGGIRSRKNGEIFANTFQGKIAECAVCNFFYKYDSSISPDFSVFGLGKWDSVDLSIKGKEIAIKSTKHFGQLLLLETKDWDNQGRYIPNIKDGICTYDYILLVRINPSCEDILKNSRLLLSNFIDRETLRNYIINQQWEYNYVGYISFEELLYLINNKQILPQGALLNGKTSMDAENYYIQAGDMHSLDKLNL